MIPEMEVYTMGAGMVPAGVVGVNHYYMPDYPSVFVACLALVVALVYGLWVRHLH